MQGEIDNGTLRTSLERLQEQHENFGSPYPPILTLNAIAGR